MVIELAIARVGVLGCTKARVRFGKPDADRRRTVTEVAGETLREIAVVVSVFYMLDNLMEDPEYPWRVSLALLGARIIAISLGIFMECYCPTQ